MFCFYKKGDEKVQMSFKEIGEVLKISKKGAELVYHRALKKSGGLNVWRI